MVIIKLGMEWFRIWHLITVMNEGGEEDFYIKFLIVS